MHRVLKDSAWLTVVFHNSSEKAWSCIQNALGDAGFQIFGTQTFDKKHGTFKMFVSDNAVGYDLVLHCGKASAISILPTDDDVESRERTLAFVRRSLTKRNNYVVRYLHVARESEFDYRRLYSEWLAQALPRTRVSLDFEAFRQLVDVVRNGKNSL